MVMGVIRWPVKPGPIGTIGKIGKSLEFAFCFWFFFTVRVGLRVH